MECQKQPYVDDDSQVSEIEMNRRTQLLRNFSLFSALFSLAHATISGVLAFSAAELGSEIGSHAGFSLYLFFALSSLLLAKPFLRYFSSKTGVVVGLVGGLMYCVTFVIALVYPPIKSVFVFGACFSGITGGISWASQSSYYAENAYCYASLGKLDEVEASDTFSVIFATVYLSLETVVKFAVTAVFFSVSSDSWRIVAFSSYCLVSLGCVAAFALLVLDLDSLHSSRGTMHPRPGVSWIDALAEARHVSFALFSNTLLQSMIPFQICFGLSSGFQDYYVNRVIVKTYIGDAYIGLLSAISTAAAVFLSVPFAKLSAVHFGKNYIMTFGSACFLFCGFAVCFFSDEALGNWPFLCAYFFSHGAGRCVFESINKAVIAEYFPEDKMRETAFAAVYFVGGLAAGFSFLFYPYMNRMMLASLNTIVPLIALACFQYGQALWRRNNVRTLEVVEAIVTKVVELD